MDLLFSCLGEIGSASCDSRVEMASRRSHSTSPSLLEGFAIEILNSIIQDSTLQSRSGNRMHQSVRFPCALQIAEQ
jgi:hypothetical protein